MEAVEEASAALLPHGAYYRDYIHLSIEECAGVNWDHPDSLETSLLVTHLAHMVLTQRHRGDRGTQRLL